MDFIEKTRSEANEVVDQTVSSIIKHYKSQKILEINNSLLPILHSRKSKTTVEYVPNFIEEIKEDNFDLILANLPFNLGHKKEYKVGSVNLGKVHENIINFFELTDLLSNNGRIICSLPPNGLQSQSNELELALQEKGLFINAVFNTPKNILKGYTPLQPILILVSGTNSNGVFIGELMDEYQIVHLLKNFYNSTPSGDLFRGISIRNETDNNSKLNPHLSFWFSFDSFKAHLQSIRIKTQFKDIENFSSINIGHAALEINTVKKGQKHTHKKQSLYIGNMGSTHTDIKIFDIPGYTGGHHTYYQVVLKEHYLAEYVSIFFKSDFGRSLMHIFKTGTIPRITKSNLPLINFTYPSLEEQKKIILAHKKLKNLSQQIEDLNQTLALNPTSSTDTLEKLDMLCNVFNALTDQDKIYMLLREGESQKLEYKQTLSMDIKDRKKARYIIHAALKTIAAFLNTSGGTLLVGVHDNGEIIGIDEELHSLYRDSEDNYFKYIKDVFKEKIGLDFWEYIEYKIVVVDNKKVLRVNCMPSEEPCFIDSKEFWIRTNPASDKLEGSKLMSYVNKRFKH